MGSSYFCFVASALSAYSSAPSDDCQDQGACNKVEIRTDIVSGLGQADWGYDLMHQSVKLYTVRGSPNGQPTGVIVLTSSYRIGKQDLGSPILGPQARQVEDLEKQDLNPVDLQIAINASAPSTINGTDAGEGISTQASTICLDSLNYPAYMLDSTTTLPQSFTGIDVQKTDLKSASEDSVIYVVELGDDDIDINPQRWGRAFKIWATILVYFHGSVVGIASSIDSAVLNRDRPSFGDDEVTESLTVALFLIAFGFGGLFAGPLSDKYGRNTVFIASWFFYVCFIGASSVSPNTTLQLSFRFFAGFFGAAPLTCGGLSIGDLWSSTERIYAFPVFANAAIMGPVLGPVIGGFIGANTKYSWRWAEWADLAAAGVLLLTIIFAQWETSVTVLLKWKARQLRAITGDRRYQTDAGQPTEPPSPWLKRIASWPRSTFLWFIRTVRRPFQITAREPILLLLSLWLTLIWILMFTFLSGYEYIFGNLGHIHETSESVTGLCFVGIAAGLLLSSATVPLVAQRLKRDKQQANQEGNPGLLPESRLWYALVSAPAIPIALFWMAWTSNRSISIWSPLAASVLLGYGMLGVFTASYEYIIHAYGRFSGPALSFNTFTRYVVAGILTIVAPYMWRNTGVQWTLTTLGCISTALVPVFYILFWWGPRIRARSQYAAG